MVGLHANRTEVDDRYKSTLGTWQMAIDSVQLFICYPHIPIDSVSPPLHLTEIVTCALNLGILSDAECDLDRLVAPFLTLATKALGKLTPLTDRLVMNPRRLASHD